MLRITPGAVAEMAAHALREAPVEACGYLAGRDGAVAEAIPMRNADASPEHFSLDPEEQFAVLRDVRARGLRILGVYHSHPATPARPSPEDLRLAHDPELSYVIVSLASGEPVVSAFRVRDGAAVEEDIVAEN